MKAWLTYDFPLRVDDPNWCAQFVLPSNLTHLEAERLCAFIKTLAVDWKREDAGAFTWNSLTGTSRSHG